MTAARCVNWETAQLLCCYRGIIRELWDSRVQLWALTTEAYCLNNGKFNKYISIHQFLLLKYNNACKLIYLNELLMSPSNPPVGNILYKVVNKANAIKLLKFDFWPKNHAPEILYYIIFLTPLFLHYRCTSSPASTSTSLNIHKDQEANSRQFVFVIIIIIIMERLVVLLSILFYLNPSVAYSLKNCTINYSVNPMADIFWIVQPANFVLSLMTSPEMWVH